MDELAAVIKDIATKTDAEYGLNVRINQYEFENFIATQGSEGTYFGNNASGRDGNMTEITCQAEIEKFLTEWQKVIDSGAYKATKDSINEEFAQGLNAIVLMSSARIPTVAELVGDSFDWNVAAVPTVSEGDIGGGYPSGSGLFMIDRGDPARLDAAWEFVQFMISGDAQAMWLDGYSYVPVCMAATETDAYKAAVAADPRLNVPYEILVNGSSRVVASFCPNSSEVDSLIKNTMLSFADGSMTKDEAYDAIVNGIATAFEDTSAQTPSTDRRTKGCRATALHPLLPLSRRQLYEQTLRIRYGPDPGDPRLRPRDGRSIAIILALNAAQFRVLGITSVCGNAPSATTAENASKVCRLLGRKDVLIYPGADQPLQRELSFSTLYCGRDGLCDTHLPTVRSLIQKTPAWEFLVRQLERADRPVTIFSTGCMTNLALALRRAPHLIEAIQEIVTMSGYFGFRPSAGRAEWNIAIDPEAAEIVYRSGARIRAFGLDVTSKLKDSQIDEVLCGKSGGVFDFLNGSMEYYRANGLFRSALLNDAMAVAAVVQPDLASYTRGSVTIDPDSPLCMKFEETEAGCVCAAHGFHFDSYVALLRELIFDASFHVHQSAVRTSRRDGPAHARNGPAPCGSRVSLV